jgi:uncharacterized protein YecT (DUF1311 family)
MGMKYCLGFLLLSLAMSAPCYAQNKVDDCDISVGTATDQYFCAQEQLAAREKKLNAGIEKTLLNSKGVEGAEEVGARILSAQKAWLQYRNDWCAQTYNSNAPIHAPSQSFSITQCQISKTNERIQEVMASDLYLNP